MRAPGTAARAGLVLLLGSAAAALGAPPASADSSAPPVVATNWYWSGASPTVAGNALPAGAPAQASGVPDGDLGVGFVSSQVSDQTGGPDKVAAIGLDLTAIPQGATFSSLRVTVPLDPGATQVESGTPALAACENIDAFADGTGPTDLKKAPPVSLPSCVKGTFADGAYTFDLTAIANDWSGGAPVNGITVRPAPDAAATEAPFSLSLKGKNGITASAVWSAPVATVPDAPAAPELPVPTMAPAPLSGAVALPPAVPGLQVPAPQVPAQPVPALVAPLLVQPIRPAASSYVPGSLVPSTTWWLGLLGLGALLGLTRLVLRDPMAPVPADPRRRRFDAVVRAARVLPASD